MPWLTQVQIPVLRQMLSVPRRPKLAPEQPPTQMSVPTPPPTSPAPKPTMAQIQEQQFRPVNKKIAHLYPDHLLVMAGSEDINSSLLSQLRLTLCSRAACRRFPICSTLSRFATRTSSRHFLALRHCLNTSLAIVADAFPISNGFSRRFLALQTLSHPLPDAFSFRDAVSLGVTQRFVIS